MNETKSPDWGPLRSKAEKLPALPVSERQPPTLIEVTGYQAKENFCSNILAFFFQTDAEHDMGDLVVSSLLEAVSAKGDGTDIATDDIKVNNVAREYLTDDGKRIDLLIETRRHIIGIENKIYAWAYNDFEEYEKTIKDLAANDFGSAAKRQPVCVLLSPYEQKKHKSFIPITYDDFFERIEKKLGKYATAANPEYLQFLLHFIRTIQNITMNDKKNSQFKEEMKAVLEKKENTKEITDFFEKCTRYKGMLDQSLLSTEHLKHFEEKQPNIINTWIHRKQTLVIDCNYDKQSPTLAIDIWTCFPDHADMAIFFRKNNWEERLRSFLNNYALDKKFEMDENIGRFRIKEPIPINEITDENNALGDLIKALFKEHETKAKQANE